MIASAICVGNTRGRWDVDDRRAVCAGCYEGEFQPGRASCRTFGPGFRAEDIPALKVLAFDESRVRRSRVRIRIIANHRTTVL